MQKKGQLTVIILIGLVLVIATAFIVSINKAPTGPTVVPEQFRPAQQAVQGCLDNTVEAGIMLAGLQGGYTQVPAGIKHLDLSNLSIPFWFDQTTAQPLTQSAAEQQLADFLNKYGPHCANQTVPGFTFTLAAPARSQVAIANDRVIATVNMPVLVTLGPATQRIDAFQTEREVPLGNAISEATAITNELERDKDSIDMTLQATMPTTNTIYNFSRLEKIILIQDNTTALPTGAFSFAFVVGLQDRKENQPPVIEQIPLIRLSQGEVMRVPVVAHDPQGAPLTYDVISNHFTIDQNGVLTVASDEPGYYVGTVRVENANGDVSFADARVIVA